MNCRYTYMITYIKRDARLGDLPGSLRTTDDAVELHRAVLARREARGEIHSVTITRIGGAA